MFFLFHKERVFRTIIFKFIRSPEQQPRFVSMIDCYRTLAFDIVMPGKERSVVVNMQLRVSFTRQLIMCFISSGYVLNC